ncbi:alpha/beta hydrolase [Leptospira sp. 96542]|nr:alpha/beta hydrolase [Leptospira sp. 96542]
MSQLTIQTKFHTIEGREWGNPQGKPILAVHGWLDNANSFLPLSEYLADFRLIAIDLPGHGKSSHKSENSLYYFSEYVLEIVSIANILKLDDFILIGHSMGAAVSTLAAGTGLLNISKLVLIEAIGPLSNLSDEAPDVIAAAIKQVLHPRGKKETYFPNWESAVGVRMRTGDISKNSVEILMERGLEKTTKGLKPRRDLKLHFNSFFRYTEEQIISFCKRITVPTLLILGNNSGYPIVNNFKSRKQAVKELKEIVLDGGHHLHMDSPEIVAKNILEFLNLGE